MNRKDFIKLCGVLGIGAPLSNSNYLLASDLASEFKGEVLVVGAGAAGLSAAYLLQQRGIQVQILEASAVYGGRMKRVTDFADFPIPTGAEWLHTKSGILDRIVNDKSIEVKTITKRYDTDKEYALADGEKVELKDLGFTIDQKFIDSTWFDFFDQYIVPTIKDKIHFNQVVQSIDYSGDRIKVAASTDSFSADKVIFTAPVKILQDDSITFKPPLPNEKMEVIKRLTFWDGFKAFIEFSEKFYPAATATETKATKEGHKLFYDASYGQDTEMNILGVFAVGPISKPYLDTSADDLKKHLLDELDSVFDGMASRT
ncbi:MAG: FAD-dependent oxidoreductase [Bacteroidota bacterium]